jgi:hypothetical protein
MGSVMNQKRLTVNLESHKFLEMWRFNQWVRAQEWELLFVVGKILLLCCTDQHSDSTTRDKKFYLGPTERHQRQGFRTRKDVSPGSTTQPTDYRKHNPHTWPSHNPHHPHTSYYSCCERGGDGRVRINHDMRGCHSVSNLKLGNRSVHKRYSYFIFLVCVQGYGTLRV